MMSQPGRTFSNSIRNLSEQQRQQITSHPSSSDLLAYHEGELEAGAQEQLQEHLAICDQCIRAVLDMAHFPDIEPEDAGRAISDAQIADELEAIHEKLQAEELATEIIVRPKRSLPYSIALPAAAVLLMANIGLAIQLQSLWEYSQPEINVGIDEIKASPQRGETTGRFEKLIQFGAADRTRTLVLNFYDVESRDFDDYAVEVATRDGDAVWKHGGFERDPEFGNFTLKIPRTFLRAGQYDFTLYGVAGEHEISLAIFSVRIERE